MEDRQKIVAEPDDPPSRRVRAEEVAVTPSVAPTCAQDQQGIFGIGHEAAGAQHAQASVKPAQMILTSGNILLHVTGVARRQPVAVDPAKGPAYPAEKHRNQLGHEFVQREKTFGDDPGNAIQVTLLRGQPHQIGGLEKDAASPGCRHQTPILSRRMRRRARGSGAEGLGKAAKGTLGLLIAQ